MSKCALIVDVIVGELRLQEFSSLTQRTKDPLCPIVGVQISNGPILYIPFLTSESIKNHLQHIKNGHQFLPLEVEESYLNEGKFIFQRGKSCLYTVPFNVSDSEGTSGQPTFHYLLMSSQNLSIIVLNALHCPPTFFGKCNVELSIQNDCEGNLQGKVQLRNHSGHLVGHLTVAITLKILGEDVALHTNKYDQETGLRDHQKTLYESMNGPNRISKETLLDKRTNDDSKKYTDVNLLSRGDIIDKSNHSNNTPDSHIEHSYIMRRGSEEVLQNDKVNQTSSDEIALKIAEFVKNDDVFEDDFILPFNNDSRVVSQYLNHPAPILFHGQDSENERRWNEKLHYMGGYLNGINSFNINNNKQGEVSSVNQGKPASSSVTVDMPDSKSQDISPDNAMETEENSSSEQYSLTSEDDQERIHKTRIYQPIRTPKGWLRSTPVASCGIFKRDVYPRLTRTSLLRRAQKDPQLEYQLNAEVNYRVKQKLQVLDRNFKDEMLFVKKRKEIRNKVSDKISIGCQVDDSKEKLGDQNAIIGRSDFSQQTALLKTANQFTQAEIRVRKEPKLEKYRTYDVDVAEASLSHKQKYDDDFEESSVSASESVLQAESKAYNEQKLSYTDESTSKSLALSDSEPQQKNRDRIITNQVRTDKIKFFRNNRISESDQSLVRSSSKHLATDSAAVIKKYREAAKSSSVSEAEFISARNSSPNPDINLPDKRDLYEALSSEAEEISEDSNLSREVYQEILKGRKADLLLRNGSQLQDQMLSDSSVTEEVDNQSKSSVSFPKNRIGKTATQITKPLRKFGETFSIGEIMQSDLDIEDSQVKSHGELSSGSELQQKKASANPAKLKSQQPVKSPRKPSKLQDHRKHPLNTTYVISPRESKVDSEESSISNISARIAALLMPKSLHVASLHTDSISSYMPSNVCDTLSSLSDVE